MAHEYDFMLPEDRAQKEAELENKRQSWISTRNRGMTRFLLFHQTLRVASLVIAWSVYPVVFLHTHLMRALIATILVLLMGLLFNLLEWHWNERRYFRQPEQNSSTERASRTSTEDIT